MSEKKKGASLQDKVIGGIAQFSFGKILDELERRVRKRTRNFARRIALTLAGIYFVLIGVLFISVSIVRIFSTIMSSALSWGLVGLVLALLGAILTLLGRLVV